MSAVSRPPMATILLDKVVGADRLGLQPPVWLTLLPEGLLLQDEDGGHALIEPARVRRLRTGRVAYQGSFDLETRLWIDEATRPVILTVHWQKIMPYKHAIGGFAVMVAAEGGIRRLERGTSVVEAFTSPAVAGIPMVVVASIIAFALPGLALWQRLAIPLSLVVLGFLISVLWRRGRPRPVRDIDDYLAILRLPRFWPAPPERPASEEPS